MITDRESEIRAAIVAHPELNDRQLGKLLDIRLWSKVRRVREALAAEAPAPAPPRLLAPDVPAASDVVTPRQPVIALHQVIVCANCGREGTPAERQPDWCKACASDPTAAGYRAAWPRPELSPAAQISLDLLASFADNPAAADLLRRRYLRYRAADYHILEAS